MKKLILALALGVGGCATDQILYKPNNTQLEFSQDRYACLQQSQQPFATSGGYVSGANGFVSGSSDGNAGMLTNRGLFRACMLARGYTIVTRQQADQMIAEGKMHWYQ